MARNNETPSHFDQAYPSRFLKASQLGNDKPTLTIANVFNETLTGERGDSMKLIIAFKETETQIVACKLNGTAIKAMFGPRCPEWIGKRITLFASDKLMPFPGKTGEEKFCVRIWGSPDIPADIMTDFRPPKRKPVKLHLHAVATKGKSATKPATKTVKAAKPETTTPPGKAAVEPVYLDPAKTATVTPPTTTEATETETVNTETGEIIEETTTTTDDPGAHAVKVANDVIASLDECNDAETLKGLMARINGIMRDLPKDSAKLVQAKFRMALSSARKRIAAKDGE